MFLIRWVRSFFTRLRNSDLQIPASAIVDKIANADLEDLKRNVEKPIGKLLLLYTAITNVGENHGTSGPETRGPDSPRQET